MRALIVAVAGFVLQTIGLAAFAAMANTSWNGSGKLLVVSASVLAIALLLFANSPYGFSRSVVQSALLALGFLIAHHTLAILFFPGLLKDIEILSIEHLHTVAPMFGLLFVLYLAGFLAAGMFSEFKQHWGERAGAQ